MKNKIIILCVFILLVFVACNKQKSADLTGKTFEQLCKDNSDIWMEMEPTLDGNMISQQKCFGCMIKDNHFCNSEDYTNYIKTK